MSRIGRLVTRSRPRFWFYLAGPVLVGIAYGATTASELVAPIAVLLFAYFLVPANAYLYGINDIFDADVDRENPKKQDREIRYRGDRLTLAAVAVSGAAGVALLFVVPAAARAWIVGFLVLATGYSAPPLRFKVRPLLDSLSNGLYVLPGIAAFAALTGTNPPTLAIAGGWLWTMAMHTFSAIPDIEPDRRAGIRTTATVLGRNGALAYCVACWLFATLAFGMLDPRAGGLLAVYPVLAIGFAMTDIDIDRAYWWYPGINVAVGTILTLGGLWGVVYG